MLKGVIKNWEEGANMWLAGKTEEVASVRLYRKNYSNVEQLFDVLKDYIGKPRDYDVYGVI